jgi:N-carbamoyl-D-amino-acid hydrolase
LASFFHGLLARRGGPAAYRNLGRTGEFGTMTNRTITVAAAQLGPIQRAEPRSVAVERMIRLLEQAHRRGVELVVFPELALTTFFPRHFEENIAAADHWFETAMPSNETAPLFDTARRLGIGFHLGFAELAQEADTSGQLRTRRFNTAILVSPLGETLLKYRKVHLPGHADFDPRRTTQHLEKRYFEVGNLGFPVIARRWVASTGSTWE